MMQIIKGMFKDLPEETHGGICIEELLYHLKDELDGLNKVWSDNNLGCIKIKELLFEKGLNLEKIGKTVKEITETIKNTL